MVLYVHGCFEALLQETWNCDDALMKGKHDAFAFLCTVSLKMHKTLQDVITRHDNLQDVITRCHSYICF